MNRMLEKRMIEDIGLEPEKLTLVTVNKRLSEEEMAGLSELPETAQRWVDSQSYAYLLRKVSFLQKVLRELEENNNQAGS